MEQQIKTAAAWLRYKEYADYETSDPSGLITLFYIDPLGAETSEQWWPLIDGTYFQA